MKQYRKSTVVVAAALCVVLFLVSVFGLHTAYGDITTNIINGLHLVPRGMGAAGSAMLFMTVSASAAEGEQPPVIDFDGGKRIIERRLAMSNLPDHEVYAMPDNNGFAVRIPYDQYTPDSVASLRRIMIGSGKFELRRGDSEDPGDVILTNEHLRNAILAVEATATAYIYAVDVQLTAAGRSVLAAAAEQARAEASSSGFSVWVNGIHVDSYTADSFVNTDTVRLTRSSGYTLSTASETATALQTGDLGASFAVTDVNINPEGGAAGERSSLLFAVSAAAALALLGIVLLLANRVVGCCSLFAMLGSFSPVFFVLTNFGGRPYRHGISVASVAAFIALLVIYFFTALRDAACIRSALEKNSLQKAVSDGLSEAFASSAKFYCALCGVGLLMFDLFNRSGGWTATAIRWLLPGFWPSNYAALSEFGLLLFVGAVSGFVFMLAVNRLMIRSSLGFRRCATEKNYGGALNAAK